MEYFLQIIAVFLSRAITVYHYALFMRFILEFTDPNGEGRVLRFVSVITEPVLNVCAVILSFIGIKNDSIIDLTFYFSIFLTWIIQFCLDALI